MRESIVPSSRQYAGSGASSGGGKRIVGFEPDAIYSAFVTFKETPGSRSAASVAHLTGEDVAAANWATASEACKAKAQSRLVRRRV